MIEESPEGVRLEKTISDFFKGYFEGLSPEARPEAEYEISRRLAYMIIKMRAESAPLPEETEQLYVSWLLSPHNQQAKDDAMMQIFEESIAECFGQEETENAIRQRN